MDKNLIKPTDKLVFDLHMHQIDYNEEKKNSLKQEISEKYNIPLKNISINFIPITVDEDGGKLSLASDIIENIQDPQFQLNLMDELIKIREIKDIDFEDIKKIDSQVNAFIDFDQYSQYKTYKFKYVKWKNYLSYGQDNYFDFTKLHGLVLLNGYPENQCGKTTFAIDLLRFALFGKAQKCPTLDSVFNVYLPEETEVIVEACIEIEGEDYVIRRTVTRPQLKKRTAKSKCKQTVEYFRILNGELELIENCEGESTQSTNNIIKESVGTVEDFNLVISATSYSLGDLLRMGQTDKGKLFSRWLGLLSIEKKEDVAKKLWKDISSRLMSNNYNRSTIESEIKDFETVNIERQKNIIDSENKLNQTNDEINRLNTEKIKVIESKKEIKEELIKLDVSTIELNIEKSNSDLENKRGQFKELKEIYFTVKDAQFDLNEYNSVKNKIEEKKKIVHEYEISNTEIKVKINNIKADNNRIQSLIDGKICPTCGQTIDVTKQNGDIEKNNLEINRLITSGVLNKKHIDETNVEISELNNLVLNMEKQRDNLNEKQKLELKMTAVKQNIDNIKLNLENLNRQRHEIETNKDNIRINNEIDLMINSFDVKINENSKIKDSYIRDIQTYKNEIIHDNIEIDNRKKLIIKLNEEEVIIKNWTIYQELVGKNGIVKIVLKRALPIINNEIDRILNGLCDFKVVLDIDNKNNVSIDMVRDDKSLDLATSGSGFEGTFASLALRTALSNLGNMPKPSFLCLDEVDSTIASTNYDKLTELYRRILNGYDFIIHIVHNPELETIHDMTVTVVKENNVSKIDMK